MAKISDKLNKIYNDIYHISDNFKSHKDGVMGFSSAPSGFKYIYALDYIDSDIRNGGIYQLHSNSTWHLILDAIEGAREFGCKELSAVLLEILYYYHKENRSKMKRRIREQIFQQIPSGWNKDLEALEDDYYSTFDHLNISGTTEIWE